MKSGVRPRNRWLSRGVGRTCRYLAATALAVSMIASLSAEVRAQDPSARAYADPPEVELGDEFRLIVEIVGARSVERVTFPESSWFEGGADPYRPAIVAKAADPEVDGSVNSIVLSYAFVARRAGLFEMETFRILADGRNLETESVAILVNRPGDSRVVVKVRVEPDRPGVGDEFELIAEVYGADSENPEFLPPDVFDFAEHVAIWPFSSGPHMSWRLLAAEPGDFVVAPIRVVDAGVTYESEPIELVITDRPPSVEIRTRLHSELIWVGGEFTLSLEVEGVSQMDDEPAIPEAVDFAELLRKHESSADSRGKSVRRRYVFRAIQAGRFEIGPVRIAAAGEFFETPVIGLTVDEMPTGAADPPEDVLLLAIANKPRAYVNEPVVVSYSLAHQDNVGWPTTGTMSWPAWDDFEFRLIGLGGGPREPIVDGHRYEARPLRRVMLRPQRPGQLDVGVVAVEVGGRWTSRGHEPWSSVIRSNPLALEVLPLPEEGRPASFRGHVGALELGSWVDRTRVEVGETVTLQIEVSVRGDVESLSAPVVDFPDGFAVGEPEVDIQSRNRRNRLRGTATFIYRLTAAAPGTYVIPAIEMSYFDPDTESYGTIWGHPFNVTVVAGEERGAIEMSRQDQWEDRPDVTPAVQEGQAR